MNPRATLISCSLQAGMVCKGSAGYKGEHPRLYPKVLSQESRVRIRSAKAWGKSTGFPACEPRT